MKRFAESSSGWLFGLAFTVLLISVWGRAVIVDTDSLSDSVLPLSESAAVVDQFSNWLGGELIDGGVDPDLADVAVDQVLASSAVDEVLEDLVQSVVAAASSSDPEGSSVDVATILAPAVPDIVATLEIAGVSASASQVGSTVGDLDPIQIRAPGQGPSIGPASPIAGRLGTASVLALVLMVIAGGLAAFYSEDRLAAIRGLLTRVALGALSFGILLRIGSWVLDPSRGRAPVSQTLGLLAHSKWLVPMVIGVVAAAGAGLIWLVRRVVRREAATPITGEVSIQQSG